MKHKPIPHGSIPTLRTALARARQLGCSVETVNRTGEVRIISPDGKYRVNANHRKTDASRPLLGLIRQVENGPGHQQGRLVPPDAPGPRASYASKARGGKT